MPLDRKRLAPDADDERACQTVPSPARLAPGDVPKRSRTQCELDEIGIIRREEAWSINVDTILASNSIAIPVGSILEAHDNWKRYRRGESLMVLCVQGNVQIHYELLCAALPDLYSISPSLQAFILCHDPSTHKLSPNAPYSLPLIQAVTPSHNHFVRLGLLHPLGGGRFPLDALVVLDGKGGRRLVLPFGWGAGKHVGTPAGRSIQTHFLSLLRSGVETLERER